MFFVIDKSKILSYIVALCTVVILFFAAANLQGIGDNSIATSTNVLSESNLISNSLNVVDSKSSTNVIYNQTINKMDSDISNNMLNNLEE